MYCLHMSDLDLAGKRVMVREDLNVPVADGKVTSDARIRAALPTIEAILAEEGTSLMILSHLGRPTEGQFEERFSLAPVAEHLSGLLGRPVRLERDWLGGVFDSGWADLVRDDYDQLLEAGGDVAGRFGVEGEGIDPNRHGPYSWWSNRGAARAKNRGWRIDYLLANAAAAERFSAAHIHRQAGLDCSDHAPVSIDLED